MTVEEAEEKYGMTVPDRDTMFELQRAEAGNPRRFQTWIGEGMPVDVMGTPSKMEAFRERQQERPPEVPSNIERQHRRSVLRSEDAARETGPAGETDVPDSVREVVASPGQSLDPEVQRAMEARMGESFADVRIHTGAQAASACEDLNARAFTVGNHIAFNHGEYDPESPAGQHVIAHELAHVRQQTGGAVSMLPQEDVGLEIDPDPQLERQADGTARRVMRGGKLGIQRLDWTEVHIQRSEKQTREADGKFGKLKEKYKQYRGEKKPYGRKNRPNYATGQIEAVWKNAKNADGLVICPITNTALQWNRNKDRAEQWHMGHKPGREYRYLVEYYIRDIIAHQTFLNEFQDPNHYRPEHPQASRRGQHEGEGEYWEQKWGKLDEHS